MVALPPLLGDLLYRNLYRTLYVRSLRTSLRTISPPREHKSISGRESSRCTTCQLRSPLSIGCSRSSTCSCLLGRRIGGRTTFAWPRLKILDSTRCPEKGATLSRSPSVVSIGDGGFSPLMSLQVTPAASSPDRAGTFGVLTFKTRVPSSPLMNILPLLNCARGEMTSRTVVIGDFSSVLRNLLCLGGTRGDRGISSG